MTCLTSFSTVLHQVLNFESYTEFKFLDTGNADNEFLYHIIHEDMIKISWRINEKQIV